MRKLFSFKKRFTYDVFLCHAFEDQESLTDRLCSGLQRRGIRVWYSAKDMPLGEDLDEFIFDRVIPQCRYGVVVISRDYFVAGWAKKELIALRRHEALRKYKMILPVWHEVDEQQVKNELPFLVNRFAARTDKGLEVVIGKLAGEIRPNRPVRLMNELFRAMYHNRAMFIVLMLFILLSGGIYRYYQHITSWFLNEKEFVEQISARISRVDYSAMQAFDQWAAETGAVPCSVDKAKRYYSAYLPDDHHGAPTYWFSSGDESFKGRRYLELFGLSSCEIYNSFGMTDCEVFVRADSLGFNYGLVNKAEVEYRIAEISRGDRQATVTVEYLNPLRFVLLSVSRHTNGKYKTVYRFYLLRASEKYVFEKAGNKWSYTANL